MNDQPVKTGTLSILVTCAVVCLAVLAILSLMTARSDVERSQEYADATSAVTEVKAQGETWRAEVDELFFEQDTSALSDAQLQTLLPAETTVDDGVLKATFVVNVGDTDGTATLTAELVRAGNGYEVRTWRVERSGARTGTSGYESIL